jgi:hypothetical protein
VRASGQLANVEASSGSLAIIFAAVQPSTAAPSHRICGKRSTPLSTSVEPQITIGIEIARPMSTSSKLPCAAPPIASTLSTPITASAITIVWIAPRIDVLAAIPGSPPPVSSVSRQPIHASATPPTSRNPGILSSHTTTDVSATRTAIAPNGAPQHDATLMLGGNVARGEADDDGVVAGQDEVDHDDRQQGRPPGAREEFGDHRRAPEGRASLV